MSLFDPLPMAWAPCADARIAYGRAGDDGPAVLLIMGFTMPGSAWRFQIDDLGRDHRVAWFDNRGSGRTEAPSRSLTMGRLADDAALLLDHLGWPQAHIVGVSMGGMIAQEFAVRYTHRLLSLSLLVTHAGGLGPALPPMAGLRHFLGTQLGPGRRRKARAVARLLFPEDWLASVDPQWLEALLAADFGKPRPARDRAAQLAAVARHNTRSRLPMLGHVRTLIVKAGRDILVNPKHNDELHRLIPNSRLVELPNAGHGLIRHAADAVNALLRTHIAGTDELAPP